MAFSAAAQTTTTYPTVADDGAPYAGISLGASTGSGVAPAVNSGNVCPVVRGVTPPCVLTGQYSRYRTSVNPNEPTLAGITSGAASSFGMTAFYKLPTTHALPPLPDPPYHTNYKFEPVIAQPLYITNVSISDANHNIVLVASLDDWVYAYDTGTGALLWSISVAGDCGENGVPFDNNYGHNPGGTNLVYYGVVAAPVVDIYSGTAPVPTAFIASACVGSTGSETIQWNLDAISLETGSEIGTTPIAFTGFNPSYQLSRASLLLGHPTTTATDIYVAFGTGANELAAAQACPTGFTACSYSGWLMLFSVTYNSSTSVTFGTPTAFATSGQTNTSVFPAVYDSFNTSGAPLGPAGIAGGYDNGDNWGVSQGGIWMSSGGPSSGATSTSNVYVASGNGPFACTNSVSSQCTTAANVLYWGESVVKFPSANSSSPMTPTDFYAPNQQNFTAHSDGDPDPSAYQTGELSRLDLDFGSTPPVIIPLMGAPYFAMVADKSGYMYVAPAEPNGTGATVKMGEFYTGDLGLTTGNTGNATTQVPFQASQLPIAPNTGNPVCPVTTDEPNWTNNGKSCDEIHEIAFTNNLAIIWPFNESVEMFQGSLTSGGGGYQYKFGTTPAFNPCNLSGSLPAECTGTHPQFPGGGQGGALGAMAIASTPGGATLWAITPEPGEVGWGWLYAYSINASPPSLTYWWDSGTGLSNCNSSPPANGWLATSFTEPTLANGAVYVPTSCVLTNGQGPYVNCLTAQKNTTDIASGILVFSTCQ